MGVRSVSWGPPLNAGNQNEVLCLGDPPLAMHLGPPTVLHVPTSWPQVGGVRPKRGGAAAVARAVQRTRADRARGHGGSASCWKPTHAVLGPEVPARRLPPGAQDAGGGRRRPQRGPSVRAGGQVRPLSASCPIRAPSVWLRPPTSGTLVRAAPPSEPSARLVQRHPGDPRRRHACRSPAHPSAPSGGRKKLTTAHADVAREGESGLGPGLTVAGSEFLAVAGSAGLRGARRRSRRDRGPCFHDAATEARELGS